jgi:hypothetical protein
MYGMSQSGYQGSFVREDVSYSARAISGLEEITRMQRAPSLEQSFAYITSSPQNQAYLITSLFAPTSSYTQQESSSFTYMSSNNKYIVSQNPHQEYHFDPGIFLKPGKHATFVGKIDEIKDHIVDTFERMLKTPFPDDLKLSLLSVKEFSRIAPSPTTIGLSYNRKKYGLTSEIFVVEGNLARVMLTIGHELGHVITPTLENIHDEEAKAFAFSIEWMRVIKEYNIANLAEVFITELPAQNGLHNVAFEFVQKMVRDGIDAFSVYKKLLTKKLVVSV